MCVCFVSLSSFYAVLFFSDDCVLFVKIIAIYCTVQRTSSAVALAAKYKRTEHATICTNIAVHTHLYEKSVSSNEQMSEQASKQAETTTIIIKIATHNAFCRHSDEY